MTELKTKATENSVEAFLNGLADAQRQQDCRTLLALMREATGAEPRLWGDSIVGFGSYRYRYASGREGDWFVVGFSPRKQNLTLYLMAGFDRYAELLKTLGQFKTGKSCLYVKDLTRIDLPTLRELVQQSAADMAKTSP